MRELAVWVFGLFLSFAVVGCGSDNSDAAGGEPGEVVRADMVLVNGHLYSLSWSPPSGIGIVSRQRPQGHDAEGIAVKDGLILAVGRNEEMQRYVGPETKLIDLGTATLLPGFVDSHTNLFELGRKLDAGLSGIALDAAPTPTADDLRRQFNLALTQMAREGYVGAHEAGVTTQQIKVLTDMEEAGELSLRCLLYTSPSPRDKRQSRMPSSA